MSEWSNDKEWVMKQISENGRKIGELESGHVGVNLQVARIDATTQTIKDLVELQIKNEDEKFKEMVASRSQFWITIITGIFGVIAVSVGAFLKFSN